MTNLVTTDSNTSRDLITFDDEKTALIKRTMAKDATDDELALFLHQCRRTGLDPLARQIYFQKYMTKRGPQIAIITGIDGYRLVADRTNRYAGSDEPVFDGRVGKYPAKATVTVWKLVGGQRFAFSASVYWSEYYPGDKKGFQWRKMPHVMLAKCAEAAALRKAFPADLSGVYTHDEMEQADWQEVTEPPKNDKGPEWVEKEVTLLVPAKESIEEVDELDEDKQTTTNGGDWTDYITAVKDHAHFEGQTKHVVSAAKILGITNDNVADDYPLNVATTLEYAKLRDSGMTQEKVVQHLKDNPLNAG